MKTTVVNRQALDNEPQNEVFIEDMSHTNTKKETANTIHIYCPDACIDTLKSVLLRHDLDYDINNYSLRDFKGKTLCHFQSSGLTKEHRTFLIGATELGAWVEPLVSYFDRKLGYTETELLHSGYFLHQKAFSILSNKRNENEKRFIDLLFVFMIGLVAIPDWTDNSSFN